MFSHATAQAAVVREGKPAWKHCRTARCVPAVIRHVFRDKAGRAIRIARCESRLHPRAVGDHGTSYGVFQIHWTVHPWSYRHTPRELFDPLHNARMAHRLSRGGTHWGPWTCARWVG